MKRSTYCSRVNLAPTTKKTFGFDYWGSSAENPPMPSLTELLGDVEGFFRRIESGCLKYQIPIQQWECDHVCYRTSTKENFQKMKEQVSPHGILLTESLINGRPIATFLLHKPLVWGNRKVSLLEIPAPKAGKPSIDGLEHVEFVVGRDPSFLIAQFPHLPWDGTGLMKSTNAELALSLEPQLQVKFHASSLLEVIKAEGNLKVTD